jgi:hypothetical protein
MAMKIQRAPMSIFTLSFLDIISCAFGAIVMLVLLAKNGDGQTPQVDMTDMSELIRQVTQTQNQVTELNLQLAQASSSLSELSLQTQRQKTQKSQLEQTVLANKSQQQQLSDNAMALQLVMDSQTQAATKADTSQVRDAAVGGIPVDSEYVIFIIDTSGSMRRIWSKLIKQMDHILDIHPQVKGFQVMNDMGIYLVSANAGKWIKDSPRVRKTVLQGMKSWYSNSNSSPVEGLEVALRTYAKPGASLAIYILGDEYNGGSYDPVIESLNRLNTDKRTGKRIARIHAIGFVSGQPTNKFSTLMREVTKQNRGTFLALPM